MAHYRFYRVRKGRLDWFEAFEAEDDVQAVRRTAAGTTDQPAELRCEGRTVRTYHGGRDG